MSLTEKKIKILNLELNFALLSVSDAIGNIVQNMENLLEFDLNI